MRPPVFRRLVCVSLLVIIPVMGEEKTKVSIATGDAEAGDIAKQLQARAIEEGKADFGYWGTDPNKYTGWTTHSNRLIPVYTFGTKGAGAGIDLDSYAGDNSLYRSEDKGETWTKMSGEQPRSMYFSQIRIDPNNDLRIF